MRVALRLLVIVAAAFCLGSLLDFSTAQPRANQAPADWRSGILHGAIMPCTLPSLVMGRPVSIYAATNTGQGYKLGYVIGVNACGAIFFGLAYWRLHRWRAGRK